MKPIFLICASLFISCSTTTGVLFQSEQITEYTQLTITLEDGQPLATVFVSEDSTVQWYMHMEAASIVRLPQQTLMVEKEIIFGSAHPHNPFRPEPKYRSSFFMEFDFINADWREVAIEPLTSTPPVLSLIELDGFALGIEADGSINAYRESPLEAEIPLFDSVLEGEIFTYNSFLDELDKSLFLHYFQCYYPVEPTR